MPSLKSTRKNVQLKKYIPSRDVDREIVKYFLQDGRSLTSENIWRDLCIHLRDYPFNHTTNSDNLKARWIEYLDCHLSDYVKFDIPSLTEFGTLTEKSKLHERFALMNRRLEAVRNLDQKRIAANEERQQCNPRTLNDITNDEQKQIVLAIESLYDDGETTENRLRKLAREFCERGIVRVESEDLRRYYEAHLMRRIRLSHMADGENEPVFHGKSFFLLYDKEVDYEKTTAHGLEYLIRKHGGILVWEWEKIGSSVLPIIVTDSQEEIMKLAAFLKRKMYSPSLIEYSLNAKKLNPSFLEQHVYVVGGSDSTMEIASKGYQAEEVDYQNASTQTDPLLIREVEIQTELTNEHMNYQRSVLFTAPEYSL